MSNLTETFCFKVSKEMKSFLDGLENPSNYARSLIESDIKKLDSMISDKDNPDALNETFQELLHEELERLVSIIQNT